MVILASGLEGYLYGVGKVGWPTRIALLLGAGGLLYPDIWSYAAGLEAIAMAYTGELVFNRDRRMA